MVELMEEEFCFTADRPGWVQLIKSLKRLDSRLLNVMECCLSPVLPRLALQKCGWSTSVIYTTITFLSHAGGLFSLPLLSYTPGVLPCGGKTAAFTERISI